MKRAPDLVIAAAGLCLAGLYVVVANVVTGAETWIRPVTFVPVFGVTGILLWVKRQRLLGAGALLFGLADPLFWLFQPETFPTLLDPIYIGATVLFVVAAFPAVTRAGSRDRSIALGATGAAAVVGFFVMVPENYFHPEWFMERTLAGAVSTIYFLMIPAVAFGAGMFLGAAGRSSRGAWFSSAGLAVWVVADMWYNTSLLEGPFGSFTQIEALWLLSPILLAAGAVSPKEARTADPSDSYFSHPIEPPVAV